jgi:hypothetical protein
MALIEHLKQGATPGRRCKTLFVPSSRYQEDQMCRRMKTFTNPKKPDDDPDVVVSRYLAIHSCSSLVSFSDADLYASMELGHGLSWAKRRGTGQRVS